MIDDVIIETGIGGVLVTEARRYFRSEIERTPTNVAPRDIATLLGMLKVFPQMIQKHSAGEVITDFKANPHHFDSEAALGLLREARMIVYAPFGQPPGEYVCFGDVSRMEMGTQCQYGSRYVRGRIDGYPNLAEGLRVRGNDFDYHSLRMHVDDVPTFLERYHQHCAERHRN